MNTFTGNWSNSFSGRVKQGKRVRFALTRGAPVMAGMALALTIPGYAGAATFNVSTVAQLIATINTANGNGQDDIINMAAGVYTLLNVNNNTGGPNGLPSITSRISINGASLTGTGSISTTIRRNTVGGTPAFRIFHIAATGNLTLDRVIVRNGLNDSGGGIIVDDGRLSLNNSTVTENESSLGLASSGGGIANFDGVVSVFNSTISNNSAVFTGGGISNSGTGSLTVIRSTVSGNDARRAGGIHNFNSMTITNSTISGNTADLFSGGITTTNTASLNHVTITANSLRVEGTNGAGGILNSAGDTLNIRNSILAENTNLAGGAPEDCMGTLSSQGRNLVGTITGCNFVSAVGDQTGTDISPVDPVLGALLGNSGNNGTTGNHALLVGSPAIDAGSNSSCLLIDQRNYVRPADGNGNGTATCDKGSHERVAVPACGSINVVLPGPIFRIDPLPATLVGTSGDNILNGTAGVDRIHGLGGNDTLNGLAGNDILCGGPGDDTLIAASGNDILGSNFFSAEDGNDTLSGGLDNDSLNGDLGNDFLDGRPGDDRLFGGRDDDTLDGGGDTDTCDGGPHVAGDTAMACETVTTVP